MGRTVLGSALAWLGLMAAVFRASTAWAQAPVVLEEAPPAPAPPPAAEPTPAPAPAPARSAPAVAPPPPLYPPPPAEPGQRPSFLHTEEEMRQVRPKHALPLHESTALRSFVARSSPWVDFSLTSFYMNDRVGNFLNFGVQAGGYFFDHLRLSARVVAPLETVNDNRNTYDSVGGFANGGSTFQSVRKASSRNVSLLYGGSIGLVVSNDKSFVFGPSLAFLRTDVEDYGTAVLVALPFEWTTARNLRVGFELALGHASGGTARSACTSTTNGITTSCGVVSSDRQGGAVVLFQYHMGWALGRL